jgi:hypothetical protein
LYDDADIIGYDFNELSISEDLFVSDDDLVRLRVYPEVVGVTLSLVEVEDEVTLIVCPDSLNVAP